MPTLKRIHDTADTLEALADALVDEATTVSPLARLDDAAIFLGASRRLRALFAPGRRCPGRMRNGPDKTFARCPVCGRLDYETNEGDPCPFDGDAS